MAYGFRGVGAYCERYAACGFVFCLLWSFIVSGLGLQLAGVRSAPKPKAQNPVPTCWEF